MTAYDGLDRPLQQREQDGNLLTWSYGGNVTTSADEAGHAWQRASDVFGHLVNVVEPTGASTGYAYDALGNLNTITQHGVSGETPRTRSFVYDSLSRLTSSTNPETGTIGYGYDSNGNLTSKTDARGIATGYTYDALNRLTNRNSAGASGVAGFNYTYGYDSGTNGIGRLVFSSNNVNADSVYLYDAMGRVVSQANWTPSSPNNSSIISSATYDLAGNVKSLTYPDGRTVNQIWDGGGHLKQVADGSGYLYLTPQTTYWPNGVPSMYYGNGVANGHNLNNRLQVNEMGVVRIGSQAPGSYTANNNLSVKEYCYGPATTALSSAIPGCPSLGSANNGNIWQVMDTLKGGRTQNFSYDSLNRLTSFLRADGSMQQSYSIDSFGNLNQTSPGTLTNNLGYNANNQINSGGYGYDAAGNINAIFNGVSTIPYIYDAENKLVNANSGAATYTYDGNGDRVRKDVSPSWTEYVRFNGQVLAEKTSDGFWSDYVYANGQRIARADNFDVRIHISGTTCSGCGSTNTVGGGILSLSAVPNNLNVVQSGDLLTWRQYQAGVGVGGIRLGLTNGNGSAGVLQAEDGQLADRDTVTGSWQMRAASLSAYQGLPISSVILGNVEGGTPGNWDIYLGDITLVHPDGTILPIYSRTLSGFSTIFKGPAESNVSVITEKVAATPNELNTTFYSGDQIGSTTILTDGAGWPVSSDIYYPFGQEATPTADNNHYKFTGQERDSEANLDYFNARHYSFAAGRFMSPDPYNGSMDLRNPQSFNRYAYVLNNPLRFTDPSGLNCTATQTINVNANGTTSGSDPAVSSCDPQDKGEWWDPVDWPGEIANLVSGWFSHPSFHGSLTPRPSGNAGWGDHYMAAQVFQGPGSGSFVAANTAVKYATVGYGAAVVGGPAAAVGGVAVASGIGGATSLNAVPTLFGAASTITLGIESAPPLPPGWTSEWVQMFGARGGFNWFDEAGGEWRLHTLDSWHDLAHWDYNPWLTWNSPWQNIPK